MFALTANEGDFWDNYACRHDDCEAGGVTETIETTGTDGSVSYLLEVGTGDEVVCHVLLLEAFDALVACDAGGHRLLLDGIRL